MPTERSSSTASSYAVAVPIGPATIAHLDARRLAVLDLLARSFSLWLLPTNEAAAAGLAERGDDAALGDVLRLAFRRGAMAGGAARGQLADRVRGVVVALGPADAGEAAAIAHHAGIGMLGLLEDHEEENQRYTAARGALSALLALRYEQMVAGAALGLDVPINLLLLGAVPSNLAAVSSQEQEGDPAAGGALRVGLCPSLSIASQLGRIASLFSPAAPARPGAPLYRAEFLVPPSTNPSPETSGWFALPPAADASMAAWAGLFAIVTGGSVETDEETILMGQAAGVPVIALDGPVARELIRPGRTGYTFSPDSLEEIRLRLDLIARFADERRRIIEGARLWTEQSASLEAARLYLTSLARSLVVSSGTLADLHDELLAPAPRAPALEES